MAADAGESATEHGVTARPWAMEVADVAAGLDVDPAIGLTAAEVAGRLAAFGRNELVEERRRSTAGLLAAQLANTMTMVLIVAAAVTLAIGDTKDAIVISAIVLVNALVGFAQEHGAEQAMAALRRMTAEGARVVREREVTEVPTTSLVPGDVVMLAAGDLVPADLRLVEIAGLRVNEAALTGESEPVAKLVHPLVPVAAIPEGLPAVVTVALALGARRMAERRAIVRKLPAVEARGAVTVICTDKTGTLTQNKMFAERVWAPDAGARVVSGEGYAPTGEVDGALTDHLRRLGRVAAACNDAVLHAPTPGGAGPFPPTRPKGRSWPWPASWVWMTSTCRARALASRRSLRGRATAHDHRARRRRSGVGGLQRRARRARPTPRRPQRGGLGSGRRRPVDLGGLPRARRPPT